MMETFCDARIEDTLAQLDEPEDESVGAPTDELRLRASDSQMVLFGRGIESSSLLGSHATVGEAVPPCSHDICKPCFDAIGYLQHVS